ncbi:MAG: DUF2157 domain-containing protein [Sulfuriferula sp.]
MISPRNNLIELIEQGAIPTEHINAALVVTKVRPDGNAWLTFVDHLLLWLGGLALSFAVMFFIAYNWNDIGRFAKFGMVEGLIAMTVVAYWKIGEHKMAGKVSLLVATLLLGVLLGLYGQTYQTGADTWQLFFTWALLMLPWTLIGRFAAIWILWVTLINLSIILYQQTFGNVLWFAFGSYTGALWLTFAFNTLALFAWEFLGGIWRWLSERWAIRLLAIGSGMPITWLALHAVFDYDDASAMYGLVWATWLAVLYFVYRKMKPDLFMLAGGCLSGIVVVVAFFAKHLLQNNSSGSFLFLALLIIGMGTGAAIWLRNIHREWQS